MNIKRRYKLLTYILLLITVNILVSLYNYKVSFWEQNEYKLDKISKQILNNVTQPLIITLYKSNNLMPAEKSFVEKIEEILIAYQKAAKVPIHLETINPNENLEIELEATNSGIQFVEHKNKNNILQKIYIGLIIQKGEQTEVLPILSPNMSIEYLISSSIRKLTEQKKRKIGLIQGHGEPSLSYMQRVEKMLLPNYDIIPVMLSSYSNILDYESLLIIAPTSQYSDSDLEILDTFLAAGKNIFVAIDRVDYDASADEGYKNDTHLEEWLIRKGLIVNSDFIVDNSASNISLPKFPAPISFPYFPKIQNFTPHVTTKGIDAIVLRFASSIEFTNKSGVTFTPLAKTSKVSGKKSLPLTIDIQHKWSKSDYLYPEQVVAAIVEDNLTENSSKIALISDGELVLDAKRSLDNPLFITNIIEWLSDSYNLISLKQKGVIKEKRNNELHINSLTKYFNLFFPLLIIGGFALLISSLKKKHVDKLRTKNIKN